MQQVCVLVDAKFTIYTILHLVFMRTVSRWEDTEMEEMNYDGNNGNNKNPIVEN
jgi:hypothetical protein